MVAVRGCQTRSYSESDVLVAADRSLRGQARARCDATWASAAFVMFSP